MKTVSKGKKIQGWLDAANARYKFWSDKYKVEALLKYYEGHHYVDQEDEYYLNLFWSTLEIKLPGMIMMNPQFFIKPKPSELVEDPEASFRVAVNLEDALHDWVTEERNHFADEMEMAALEAFFGFGVVEIGYSGNFVENPNAAKPTIPGDYDPDKKDQKGSYVDITVENEKVYVKQIPFTSFRTSSLNHRYLDRCDWFGYFEYARISDLKADKTLKNTEKINEGNYSSAEVGLGSFGEEMKDSDFDTNSNVLADCVKIWKIWDNRSKKRFIYCEDSGDVLHEKKWKINPIETLCYRYPRKGFYPIPYTFNWIPQQNEINETRETHRIHRRKFRRLYEVKAGTVDLDDLKAFINGPDGGVIEVNQSGQINPIPTAELGASSNITMQISKDDFNIISGTSAEAQGAADRITATQANITNQRAGIRESRERELNAKFLNRVAKKILMIMRDNYVNKFTVASKSRVENFGEEIQTGVASKTIDPITDLGDSTFDFGVEVSVASMSPIESEENKNRFLTFLSLLKQFPEFSQDPNIIREMAHHSGYKNEAVIRSFQRMAQLAMVSKIEQGQQNLAQQGGNLGQQTVEQQTPPNNAEIVNQLREQGLPMGS